MAAGSIDFLGVENRPVAERGLEFPGMEEVVRRGRAEPARDLARRERLVHDEAAGADAAPQVVPSRAQQEARAEEQIEVVRRQRVGVEVRRPRQDPEPAPGERATGRLEPIDCPINAVREESRLRQRDGVAALPHREVEGAPRPRAAVHFRRDPGKPLGDERRDALVWQDATHTDDCTCGVGARRIGLAESEARSQKGPLTIVRSKKKACCSWRSVFFCLASGFWLLPTTATASCVRAAPRSPRPAAEPCRIRSSAPSGSRGSRSRR